MLSIIYRGMVVYVVPASSVLGRLPVVRAGDTGTIPFRYSAGLRNGRAHRYDHDLARADTRHWAGDGRLRWQSHVFRQRLGAWLVQGYVNEWVRDMFLTRRNIK